MVGRNDSVTLSKEYSSSGQLPLPSHYILAIRIFNVPPKSKDSDGNQLKVFFLDIPIAYALDTKKREPQGHSRKGPKRKASVAGMITAREKGSINTLA